MPYLLPGFIFSKHRWRRSSSTSRHCQTGSMPACPTTTGFLYQRHGSCESKYEAIPGEPAQFTPQARTSWQCVRRLGRCGPARDEGPPSSPPPATETGPVQVAARRTLGPNGRALMTRSGARNASARQPERQTSSGGPGLRLWLECSRDPPMWLMMKAARGTRRLTLRIIEASVLAVGRMARLAAAEMNRGHGFSVALVRQQFNEPGFVLHLFIEDARGQNRKCAGPCRTSCRKRRSSSGWRSAPIPAAASGC